MESDEKNTKAKQTRSRKDLSQRGEQTFAIIQHRDETLQLLYFIARPCDQTYESYYKYKSEHPIIKGKVMITRSVNDVQRLMASEFTHQTRSQTQRLQQLASHVSDYRRPTARTCLLLQVTFITPQYINYFLTYAPSNSMPPCAQLRASCAPCTNSTF